MTPLDRGPFTKPGPHELSFSQLPTGSFFCYAGFETLPVHLKLTPRLVVNIARRGANIATELYAPVGDPIVYELPEVP